jgi:hypothetical protein
MKFLLAGSNSQANLIYCNTCKEVCYPLLSRSRESILATTIDWLELYLGKKIRWMSLRKSL